MDGGLRLTDWREEERRWLSYLCRINGVEPGAALDGRYIQLPNGKMNGSLPGGGRNGTMGKTKYAPSQQRNLGGIQLAPKRYAKLTGVLNTHYPNLPEGAVRQIRDAGRRYTVQADGYGGMKVLEVKRIK